MTSRHRTKTVQRQPGIDEARSSRFVAAGTGTLLVLTAITMLFTTACVGYGSEGGTIRGRIEIKNAKVKLRGVPDASGVAVWLVPSKAEAKPQGAPARGRVEQRDKRFIPHVTIVRVGTEINFPNQDPYFHNVFSTFDGKAFDLGLYANGESRPVRFNRPGISYIYCNIHPQMSAVIITVDTPYFALTGPDGAFSVNDVPIGDYELHFWHERSDAQQLDGLRRVLPVRSSIVDLGAIGLDEAGYIPMEHKNKHGEEYGTEPATYRRP